MEKDRVSENVEDISGRLSVPLSAETKKLLIQLSKSPFWPNTPNAVAAELIRIHLRELAAEGWQEYPLWFKVTDND